ncbi:hypothetical protein BGX26_010458 [Mortierella sp. AD094]|nr:hypothetical protein BGX26_010458 [Mortierella sp. AD094]
MLKMLVPSAAIRILRPTQSRRPLSCSNLAEAASTDQDSTDPITLSNEFGRTEGIEDLTRQLEIAGFTDIEVVPISLDTTVEVADMLGKEMEERRWRDQDLVVFQLCDGTELDGYPGVSVMYELEKRKIAYTGADSAFYILSTSKPVLKRELQASHVPTSAFQEFSEPVKMADLENIINEIGFPMVVKPSISYASIDISTSSVVHTPTQLLEQINRSPSACNPDVVVPDQIELCQEKEREQREHKNGVISKAFLNENNMGIDIETPTVFVERFLAGREFTVLMVGDEEWGVKVYPVAERAFDPKLGKFERILAFDKYWEGYDLEGGHGKEDDEEFCKYQMANEAWQDQLQEIAKNAYLALRGTGYGRVDIRTLDMDNCEPVVLEVNANCALSFEKDSSSMANILNMSDIAPPGFVRDLEDHALHRNRVLYGVPNADDTVEQSDSNHAYNSNVDNAQGLLEVVMLAQ